MKALQAIAVLLDYPKVQLYSSLDDIKLYFEKDTSIPFLQKQKLFSFIEHFQSGSLLDWQAYYEGLFDRGRALSMLLFEHVHGESRDRGQAMIDLQQSYKEAGLEIGVKELPDYIPLFLEFLSTQGDENARLWLQDISHILGLLAARLEKRESPYHLLFEVIIELCGAEVDLNDLKEQIANEKRDDTPKEIDKVWEEEMVTFGPENACGHDGMKPSASQSRQAEVPIGFVTDSGAVENQSITTNRSATH